MEEADRYVEAIDDYYEQLWERLPGELESPDFELRRHFLLSEVKGGERALDLGCGTGTFTAQLASAAARAIGVDVAQGALSRARAAHPELDFRLVPIDGPLPFADGEFELVWASEVLEHVADTQSFLLEVRRVLAPQGRLLLTTPSHGRLRLALLGIERFSEPFGDHLHLYTRRSLIDALSQVGFQRITVGTAGGPPLLRRLLLARALRPAT